MSDLEDGYVHDDSLYFFRHPVTTTDGIETDISTIIDPEKQSNYIICISSPGL